MSKKSITLASLPLILASSQAFTSRVYAEDVSVGIFPTITQITAQSGEALETKVAIKNYQNTSVTLTTLLQPFTASGDEDGRVRYLNEAPTFFHGVQIISDGQLTDEIELAPNEEKSVTMRIHLPTEQSSHDYYYSLVLLTKPSPAQPEAQEHERSATSKISSGVAAHFLVSVNPEARSDLSVAEFSAPPLTQQTPVPFRVRIANLGPNFTKVSGTVDIRNILGMSAEAVPIPETTILSQSRRALANSSRETSQLTTGSSLISLRKLHNTDSLVRVWQSGSLFPGIYRAELHLRNATDKQVLRESTYFIVAPVQVFLVLFFILAIMYVVIKRVKRKLT